MCVCVCVLPPCCDACYIQLIQTHHMGRSNQRLLRRLVTRTVLWVKTSNHVRGLAQSFLQPVISPWNSRTKWDPAVKETFFFFFWLNKTVNAIPLHFRTKRTPLGRWQRMALWTPSGSIQGKTHRCLKNQKAKVKDRSACFQTDQKTKQNNNNYKKHKVKSLCRHLMH